MAACAKHFPGHGDTTVDSHLALPVVERLDDSALTPFRAAIEAGTQAIMSAHIVVRQRGNSPATMSRDLLHDVLRGELGFSGLVVTDALEMKAISATVGVEEGAVRAIAAGADALCLGHDLFDDVVTGVRRALVAAVEAGRVSEERLAGAAAHVETVATWAAAAAWSGRCRPRHQAAMLRSVRCESTEMRASCGPRASSSSCPRSAWPPGDSRSCLVSGSRRPCRHTELRRFEHESAVHGRRARRPAARRDRRDAHRHHGSVPWPSSR